MEAENAFELSLAGPDSSALANKIKSIQIHYQEKQRTKRVIRYTDFDSAGKIKKLIDYNYLSPKDSLIITVLENNSKKLDIQTKIKPPQSKENFQYRNDLMLAWPDYRDITDTVYNTSFCLIRKSYDLGYDSLISVSTFVNNKKIETKSILNPTFKGSGYESPYKVIKYDSAYYGDTLVKFSRFKNFDGDSMIWRMYELKDKIIKEEDWIYGNRIRGHRVSVWKYDLLGRVIYFEKCNQDKDKLRPITIKEFIYNKDGTRIETDDNYPMDGHIGLIDEFRKYDQKNKLIRLVKYQYDYDKDDKYKLFGKAECIFKYNLKGLITIEDFYINSVSQKQRQYIYTYY